MAHAAHAGSWAVVLGLGVALQAGAPQLETWVFTVGACVWLHLPELSLDGTV